MPMFAVTVCVVGAIGGLPASGASSLDFEKRVSAQAAIEGVYWRHRIWPSDNPGPKPSFEQVFPETVLRARVEDYLLESKALELLWGRPIRDEELQAEIARMAASSRAPEVLREIFAALDDDPTLVAECMARPLLADRLIRDAYAHDPRYHLAQRDAIEQALAQHGSVDDAKSLGGEYREAVWVVGGGGPEGAKASVGGRVIRMNGESWRSNLARLRAALESPSAIPPRSPSDATTPLRDLDAEDLPLAVFSRLQENDESFFVQAVLETGNGRLRVATVVWRKRPFDAWWARARTNVDASASAEAAPLVSGGTSRSGADGEARAMGADSQRAVPSLPRVITTACTPDTWTAVQSTGAPSPREAQTAVWTGTEMIVWGGYNATSNTDTNTGGRYTPATDSWTATSTTGAPDPRDTHTAVWAGTSMVVWGGGNEVFVPKDSGGRYDPTTNTWLSTATTGAPTAREYHTAVWSGSRMVVWGGWDGTKDIDTGGRYDPTSNSWATTAKTGAPAARDGHTAIWTGTAMVVWGGEDDTAIALNTGSRYDPAGNSWSSTATTLAPAARVYHTAVWTGSTMIVWGGFDGAADLNTGGSYNPSTDAWTLTSTLGAPAARDFHSAVWTGSSSEMDVWGGQNDAVVELNTGGRYNATTDAWTAMSALGAPIGRRYDTSVWTGSEMVVWGGWNVADLDSGARYCSGACASSPPDGSAAISVGTQTGADLVAWTAAPGAAASDLVRGALAQLRASGGDFTTSTQACLANDQVATSYSDSTLPLAANGFWYLVRGVSCGGSGTYDSIDPSQIGSRDAEINASSSSCP